MQYILITLFFQIFSDSLHLPTNTTPCFFFPVDSPPKDTKGKQNQTKQDKKYALPPKKQRPTKIPFCISQPLLSMGPTLEYSVPNGYWS